MNVVLYVPKSHSGHEKRGIGVYGKHLIEALKDSQTEHKFTVLEAGSPLPNSTDLVHYTFFDPFFLTLPLQKKEKTIVTVHDLIPLRFPEKFPKGVRGSIKWGIQKMSLSKVIRVITDSESSKHDIEKYAGIPSERIDPIYLAPTLSPRVAGTTKKTLQDNTPFPNQYILYVGDVNWNKYVIGLLRAFKTIVDKKPNMKLICVGAAFKNKNLKETEEILSLIKSFKLSDAVLLPGFVDEEVLKSFYTEARLTVVPSHYEGFGFSVLDAFVSGSPVVASDNSSLSEINGPAFQCEASSVESIAKAMLQVLSLSQVERESVVKKGYTWVSRFTWKKTAAETIASYEKAYSSSC